jgi:hypothetical protein
MAAFNVSIGREVPKEGDTCVVFSIRTARGTRMELDGTFTQAVAEEVLSTDGCFLPK